jgi:hypothetical protein
MSRAERCLRSLRAVLRDQRTPHHTVHGDLQPNGLGLRVERACPVGCAGRRSVVSREVVEFGFAVFGVAVMTKAAIV